MNQASNASGTTQTTVTVLDAYDCSASISVGCSSLHTNGDISNGGNVDVSSSATPSLISTSSTRLSNQSVNKIFSYSDQEYTEYDNDILTCEDICLIYCRKLKILPTTRLLFGLRVLDSENEWAVPGHNLRVGVRYCFRMRIKVPNMDTQLHSTDPAAYEYLYWQMRYDMVNESIPEIRYPEKKDNMMGLAVMDMYIDFLEQRDTAERIESNYKRYLPRKLLKVHRFFVQSKICSRFRQFRAGKIDLVEFKYHYVSEVCKLASNYLMETYVATVSHIPNMEPMVNSVSDTNMAVANGLVEDTGIRVFVKLDTHDHVEPGLKISREKVKWILVAKLDSIYAMYIEGGICVCLEITGFPQGYRMRFESRTELESFITYLGGYVRLTSKWMLDLCVQYPTPSLKELKELRCHGPIGGGFSFTKLREKSNKGSSCIVRQCEKEYDVYYIDINTQTLLKDSLGKHKTETFKITRDRVNNKWFLHLNDSSEAFGHLKDLVRSIPVQSSQIFWLPPSEYDKPPLLLICLPKNLQPKKTDTELSETELLRRKVQIFDRKNDLLWYKNTSRICDNGKMMTVRGDWIQEGSYKDVSVTLKILCSESDHKKFTDLACVWSQIYSPNFLKLYGLTLTTPYTMVMEYSRYGALDEFLRNHKDKVSVMMLLSVVHDLVRGIVYLQEKGIYHGFIRCSNVFVTKFDPKSNIIETKIGDPRFPRSYSQEDLPWIPQEFYNNLKSVCGDMYAEFWAFATTVWEIFERGKSPLDELKSVGTPNNSIAEKLQMNRSQTGGILPKPSENCPEEIYYTMLDGWSLDAHNRFHHQEIFARLSAIKEQGMSSYATCTNGQTDDCSLHSLDYSDMGASNCLLNSNSGADTLSNNSTTPLIQHNQRFQRLGMANNRTFFDDTPSVLPVSQGKIIFHRKIGEGHYGTVFLGEMRYNTPNKASEQVAIKTLKLTGPATNTKDFMREIRIMQSLDHPNVVKIKYSVREPISIIMEYLAGGSFHVYLLSQRPNLTNARLLRFAHDIAKGMDYLANKNVIHRDLATRNILVDTERVKISDFGLAQFANADGYYLVQSEREIPIKWYSPESIAFNKFSTKSDVWSYGVTLFETFSRGEMPNLDPTRELSQEEFLQRLERGDRLPKPPMCPQIVYEKLMQPCWRADSKMRPTFATLLDIIQSIINEDGENI